MLVQPTVPEMELLQSKRSTLYTHFFIKGHKWPIQKWHTPCWGQFGLLCLWYSKCLVLQLNGFPLQYIYSLLKHQHKPFPASLSSSLTNSSPAAVKSTMLPHEVSLKHGKAIQQKFFFIYHFGIVQQTMAFPALLQNGSAHAVSTNYMKADLNLEPILCETETCEKTN